MINSLQLGLNPTTVPPAAK